MVTAQEKTVWSLRLSLGAMYLYSGYDIFMHPTGWIWAIPLFLKNLLTSESVAFTTFLKVQGASEFLFGLIMLSWFLPNIFPRIVAGLTAIEMALIIGLYGVDSITFRDISIMGAGAALYFVLEPVKAMLAADGPPTNINNKLDIKVAQ